MDIAQELTTLNTAKQDMKAAIIEKGQTVGDDMNDYAEAISNISGGTVDDTNYLCFEALDDTGISLNTTSGYEPNIEYSLDKLNWTTWDYNNIDLTAGQKIYFRGDNPNGFTQWANSTLYINYFAVSTTINIYGDMNTLILKDGNITALPCPRCFILLFRNVPINTANLYFNENVTLSAGCYLNLFRDSTIKYANFDIPYQTLPAGAFQQSFMGCTSLVKAPYIKTTTLVMNTSVEGADAGCYGAMFRNCSSLQYLKTEFKNYISSDSNLNPTLEIFNSVSTTGCYIKAKDATWTTKGRHSCPSSWTLITSVS